MCGIFGYITNKSSGFSSDEIAVVKDITYISGLRGMDSTGFYYLNTNYDLQIYKDVIRPSAFIESKTWESIDRELWRHGKFIVGHCRAATRGAKTEKNAHPFHINDKIVLVHNGTLYDHRKHADVDVDSEAIAHLMADDSETIEDQLKKLNGAYALAWYNVREQCLHLVRNKERPLWIVQTDKGIIFSSELGFIHAATWRNNIKFRREDIKELTPHVLYTIDFADIEHPTITEEKLDCEYVIPVAAPAPASTNIIPFHPKKSSSNTSEFSPNARELFKAYQRPGRLNYLDAAEIAGVEPWKQTITIDNSTGEFLSNYGEWKKFLDRGDEVYVEALTWIPAVTNDVSNKNYYVFGQIISTDDRLNEFPVLWEIQAPSEEAVNTYVQEDYFEGKVEFPIGRGIPKSNKEWAVFKLFDVQPVSNETNKVH
jgi:predicted glutamine amidotransferase